MIDDQERMLDLLTQRAAAGLSVAEERELAALLDAAGSADDDSFDAAAAALFLSETDDAGPMPEHLKAAVMSQIPDERPAVSVSPERSNWFAWLGWACAGVATAALIVSLVVPRRPADVAVGTPTPSPAVSPKPDDMMAKYTAMAAKPGMVHADFAKGSVKTMEVSGDVVWDDATQTGYMRLRGLPMNDTSKESYQLWIFDESQDEKTPIDGGVFNVGSNGEVKRLIQNGAISVNGQKIAENIELTGKNLVKKGKNSFVLVR